MPLTSSATQALSENEIYVIDDYDDHDDVAEVKGDRKSRFYSVTSPDPFYPKQSMPDDRTRRTDQIFVYIIPNSESYDDSNVDKERLFSFQWG